MIEEQARLDRCRRRVDAARSDPFRPQATGWSMKVESVPRIAGAMLFMPTPHSDSRGFFCRTFDKEVVRRAGIEPDCFTQDSVSRSSREWCAASTCVGVMANRSWSDAHTARCST